MNATKVEHDDIFLARDWTCQQFTDALKAQQKLSSRNSYRSGWEDATHAIAAELDGIAKEMTARGGLLSRTDGQQRMIEQVEMLAKHIRMFNE